MPKFRLNHHCRKPGCEGNAGEVIDVSKADADYLLDRRGGELVNGKQPPPPVRTAVGPAEGEQIEDDEADEDAQADETAETEAAAEDTAAPKKPRGRRTK